MFGVEEHGRDGYDQPGGSQQGGPSGWWFTWCEGWAHIRNFVCHSDKLGRAVCA